MLDGGKHVYRSEEWEWEIELNISIAAADVWTVRSGYFLVFIPGFICTVGRMCGVMSTILQGAFSLTH